MPHPLPGTTPRRPWLAAMAAVVMPALLAGCQIKNTSDRDLLFVDSIEAEAAVEGRSSILGLGAKTAGAWVDPRSDRQYAEGHIPGAIHLPLEHIETAEVKLKGLGVLVVYGDSYNSVIALAMSKELIARGFPDVFTLRGGLEAWTRAGNLVEEKE